MIALNNTFTINASAITAARIVLLPVNLLNLLLLTIFRGKTSGSL